VPHFFFETQCSYCLNAGDVTANFQPVNKEYLLTRQLFFIDHLTADSATHFGANTTILRQTVPN